MTWQCFNDTRDTNKWTECKDGDTFASELLNRTEIDLGAGVTMIQLSKLLQKDNLSSRHLFTRHDSRLMWQEVYKYLSRDGTHALVTGNPGIGKSRSLMYMIKLLLEDSKLVIFESRRQKQFFAIVPPAKHGKGNSYKVWSTSAVGFNFLCPALQDPSNFYLVDPGAVAEGPTFVEAHIVLAASPNRDHYHEFIKDKGVQMYMMPPWTCNELIAVRSVIDNEAPLSESEISSRFYKFGGIPRYVYALNQQYHDAIETALSELSFTQLLKSMEKGSIIEMNQSSAQRVPSILFQYKCVTIDQQASYKMESSNYRLEIASGFVLEQTHNRFWKEIANALNPKSIDYTGSFALGRFFEAVAVRSLSNGGIFKVHPLTAGSSQHVNSELTLSKAGETSTTSKSHAAFFNAVAELPSSVDGGSKRAVVVPGASNQPVVDMMDAKNRAYQCTLQATHSVKANLAALLKKTNSPLDLYFVVPPARFEEFHLPTSTIVEWNGKGVQFFVLEWKITQPQ